MRQTVIFKSVYSSSSKQCDIVAQSLETGRPHLCSSTPPLIARFMGPTWGPSGTDRTQVGPMLPLWTLLPGTAQSLRGQPLHFIRCTLGLLTQITATLDSISFIHQSDQPCVQGWLTCLYEIVVTKSLVNEKIRYIWNVLWHSINIH